MEQCRVAGDRWPGHVLSVLLVCYSVGNVNIPGPGVWRLKLSPGSTFYLTWNNTNTTTHQPTRDSHNKPPTSNIYSWRGWRGWRHQFLNLPSKDETASTRCYWLVRKCSEPGNICQDGTSPVRLPSCDQLVTSSNISIQHCAGVDILSSLSRQTASCAGETKALSPPALEVVPPPCFVDYKCCPQYLLQCF